MEKIKELLQNKKILAAVLIVFVCILFAIVFVSNRSEKKSHSKNGIAEASGTDVIKSANIEETKSSEENTEKKTDMELETDEQGNISSVITENGETINLSSDEVETETKADGSVSYKLADGSELVVNQNGTATVTKKEEIASHQPPVTGTNTEATTKAETADNSSQAGEVSSPDKEENTTVTKPTTTQSAQPTESVPQESPTQQPTEPQTSPQPAPEPPTPQPTECQHISTIKRIATAATDSSEGLWEKVCANCGQVLETGTIHPYSAYEVDLGNGQTATIYGYYDNKVADEVYVRLNTYRQENGVNPLARVFDEQSKIRVVECAYSFGHSRPNGTEPEDMHKYMFGENCGLGITGLDTAQAFMDGLKASPGHNSNMLDSDCTMCGISVFHRVDSDEYGVPYSNMTFIVQNFGFEW